MLSKEADNPKGIVVVTDDREIRYFVRSLGARLMGAREFLGRVRPGRDEIYAAKKLKAAKADQKEISNVLEGKITSEMARIWLKGGA